MNLEELLQSWAQPPSEAEQVKCDNSVRAVRKAIDASTALSCRNVRVFAQGSYCNRTNVKADSDVDICVLCGESIFFQLPSGMTVRDVGLAVPASYGYSQFKTDVRLSLEARFGVRGVSSGHKAFDVHENTYRLDADIVACFQYRLYGDDCTYREGTAFLTDTGHMIVNWPDQNYKNGVVKNNATGQRFKGVVRTLKRLRNTLLDDGLAAAQPIPSYFIECLVWNVPNEYFGHEFFTADVRASLAHLFNHTISDTDCREWGEINECKYLFRPSQPWTLKQAHEFISSAWDYLGFG
jgi:hypothetical protein